MSGFVRSDSINFLKDKKKEYKALNTAELVKQQRRLMLQKVSQNLEKEKKKETERVKKLEAI